MKKDRPKSMINGSPSSPTITLECSRRELYPLRAISSGSLSFCIIASCSSVLAFLDHRVSVGPLIVSMMMTL
jgi:hypothetical protein